VSVRRWLVVSLVAAVALAPVSAADAARSLRASALLTIDGAGLKDRAGSSVASAGDVNGDGIPDVVVGAPGLKCGGGAAYVVFGSRRRAVVRLSALGRHGFAIVAATRADGARSRDCVGREVAGAGDVNRDGLADVIVGAPGPAPRSAPEALLNPGAAYVVFGKRSSRRIDLGSLGARGYAIRGGTLGGTGSGVANAGDINADGRPDALVSDREQWVYVVYGKADAAPIDLAALGSRGYTIAGDIVASTVAGIGDVNGDHRPDIGLGIDFEVDNGAEGAFFFFGGPRTGTVSIWKLGLGFLITGRYQGSFAGSALAGAGDVNGDGLADVLVGADGEGCSTCGLTPPVSRRDDAGAVYLVFGRRRSGNLGPGATFRGIYFVGPRRGGELGASVARVGDVNRDGVQDFAFGAPGPSQDHPAFRGRKVLPGSVFVVFGERHMRSLDLAHIDAHGFELRGRPRDHAGAAIDGVGDMNGDRRPDLIVGAPGARGGRGVAYVVSLAR